MSVVSTHFKNSRSKLRIPEMPSFARSIGIGGLLGCLAAYLFCLRFPHLIIGGIGVQQILIFGSALGFCVHRLLTKLIGDSIAKPIYKFAAYYARIAQLEFQRRLGLMDEVDQKVIKRRLDYDYFLGEVESNVKPSEEVADDLGAADQNGNTRRKVVVKHPRAVASIKTPPTTKSEE